MKLNMFDYVSEINTIIAKTKIISRKVAQKTKFTARKCPRSKCSLNFYVIWGVIPKTPKFNPSREIPVNKKKLNII